MMEIGAIHLNQSPFSSDVKLVQKDGSIRFYTECRTLNQRTLKVVQAILRVDDTLHLLAESK